MPTQDSTNFDNALPYDLRQIYAVNIVGEHLQDVARARKMNDLQSYYNCLKDLWVITQSKIKERDKKAPEEYKKLLIKAIEKINQNPNEFKSKTGYKNPKGFYEIEQALNDLEMFLYDKIEEAKMFGSKQETEHLA